MGALITFVGANIRSCKIAIINQNYLFVSRWLHEKKKAFAYYDLWVSKMKRTRTRDAFKDFSSTNLTKTMWEHEVVQHSLTPSSPLQPQVAHNSIPAHKGRGEE